MVIGKVAGQEALEMPLMQDDYMIQALTPDTPNQTLHIWILPGTLWSGQHLFETHMPHPLSKGCTVDTITIA
jgi:hypothetical protein